MNSSDKSPLLSIFKEKCKEHHLKITPQRIIIYEELLKAKDHPSVDMVFQKVRSILPTISFDTVYRTMSTFTEVGIIEIVEGYSGVRRFDADVSPHHHFICLRCNRIIDFWDKNYNDLPLPQSMEAQHVILKKKVILEGICNQCRQGQKE
ncbi:MAG: Fur family transcriptional regulator [bacterium]